MTHYVKDAIRLLGVRRLMGYVIAGTNTTVSFSQDDATDDYVVQVGKRTYYSRSFTDALDKAIADLKEE